MKKTKVIYQDWGRIPYMDAWNKQEQLFQSNIQHKSKGEETDNWIVMCEHPHVYTLGKSGNESNLLMSETVLQANGATFVKTNRGGDITYHGPGQIVGYPIIDLENYGISLREYIHRLEEVVILTLADYGIIGERYEGATGVWLDVAKPSKRRKICAIGVKASRYVTMHGFALNITTDLSYFQAINPCGFIDGQVTSLYAELFKISTQFHEYPTFDEVKETILEKFEKVFAIHN